MENEAADGKKRGDIEVGMEKKLFRSITKEVANLLLAL